MSDKVASELRDIFNELGLTKAEAGQVMEDIAFADLDLDSLTLMDLCVALEERFEVTIEPADVVKQGSVQGLARFIAEKRAATS